MKEETEIKEIFESAVDKFSAQYAKADSNVPGGSGLFEFLDDLEKAEVETIKILQRTKK